MIITPQGFAVLDPSQDALLSRWVEQQGVLCVEGNVLSHYLPHIARGDVVVDAGAAIGDHTTAYLEKVGPEGKVLAFEPHFEMFECLEHNCPAALCFRVALGERYERRSLVVDSSNAGASCVAKATEFGDYAVDVYPLDYITPGGRSIDRLNFFKIDVEGMELEVLKGAIQTIRRCRPLIVLECNPMCLKRSGTSEEELERYLVDNGYSVRVFLGSVGNSHWELLATPK